MGFFQAWSAVNICLDAIARYGIDAKSISPDLCARVCKYTCEKDDKTANGDANALDFKIRRSAALIAMSILGPSEFFRFRYERYGITADTLAQAAASFTLGRHHAASLDLKIIYAVAESGHMNREFSELFSRQLAQSAAHV